MADLREITRVRERLQAFSNMYPVNSTGVPDRIASDFLAEEIDVLYELVNDRYWELKHAGTTPSPDPLHY